MKKVLQEKVLEEAIYYCDKHPNRECFSELTTVSWYGSKFDMTGIEVHLCDECLHDMFDYLYSVFAIKPKDIEI